jgi:hypothetical protein
MTVLLAWALGGLALLALATARSGRPSAAAARVGAA